MQRLSSQVCAEKCNFLEAAKEHRGKSEPLFLLYRVRHGGGMRPCPGRACMHACRCSFMQPPAFISEGRARPRPHARATPTPMRCATRDCQHSSCAHAPSAPPHPPTHPTSPTTPRLRTHIFVQNGQLKAKIDGANTPALSSQILSLTPANADVDDLEVPRPWPGPWATANRLLPPPHTHTTVLGRMQQCRLQHSAPSARQAAVGLRLSLHAPACALHTDLPIGARP